jgi:hypothetical protein
MLLFGALLGGCNMIYEDLSECPQGVYVKFYSKTPCAVDSTYIGQVSDLHIFAFDDKDVLVSTVLQKNVSLDKDYKVLVPVSNGYFSFIGWAGVNNYFTQGSFVKGVTTKRDVMLTLNAKKHMATALKNHKVWQGESPTVFLEDPAKVGTTYKHTAVNLREVTNRLNVEVELHESVAKDIAPEDFDIEITSGNSVMNIDGSMPLKQEILTYPATISFDKNKLTAKYSLMKLKTGYDNQILLRNKKTGDIIWKTDLIGSILIKNHNVNLDCENDFNVKFVLKDKCLNCGTYYCWAIYVNDWMVHSYEVELETP